MCDFNDKAFSSEDELERLAQGVLPPAGLTTEKEMVQHLANELLLTRRVAGVMLAETATNAWTSALGGAAYANAFPEGMFEGAAEKRIKIAEFTCVTGRALADIAVATDHRIEPLLSVLLPDGTRSMTKPAMKEALEKVGFCELYVGGETDEARWKGREEICPGHALTSAVTIPV